MRDLSLALLVLACTGSRAAGDATGSTGSASHGTGSRGQREPRAAAFALSNTLGDHMTLQRDSADTTVWGFADPGDLVSTAIGSYRLAATVGSDGVWRQRLPPHPASLTPTSIRFTTRSGKRFQKVILHLRSLFLP